MPMGGPFARVITTVQVGHPAFDEELSYLPMGRRDLWKPLAPNRVAA